MILLSTSSCARIFGNKYQTVSFSADKPDTNIFVDGVFMGTVQKNSPVEVKIPLPTDLGGRDLYNIRYEAYGYGPVLFTIEKTPGAYGINQLLCTLDKFPGFLLILPPIISYKTGACTSFNDNYYKNFDKILPTRSQQNKRYDSNSTTYYNENPEFKNTNEYEDSKIGVTEDGMNYYVIEKKQNKLNRATDDKIKQQIKGLTDLYGIDTSDTKIDKLYTDR